VPVSREVSKGVPFESDRLGLKIPQILAAVNKSFHFSEKVQQKFRENSRNLTFYPGRDQNANTVSKGTPFDSCFIVARKYRQIKRTADAAISGQVKWIADNS
jgi:hypothetical protein